MTLSIKKPQAQLKSQAIGMPPYPTEKDSVFSYAFRQSRGSLALSQVETGFCVEMGIEKGSELRVKGFVLQKDESLEDVSVALYDAALIEIVLHALVTLLTYAEHHGFLEISFILPPEDAMHLTCFEGFVTPSSVMTREGQKTTFSLFTIPEAQAQILQKAAFVKTQVHQELWKAQRDDPYLRDYLQHPRKGNRLSWGQERNQETAFMNNVLPFSQPQSKK